VVDPAAMRHTLAGFATGLTVVAADIGGEIVGMPANSLVSVSLDPPLVSLSFAHTSTTWPVLRRAERWGISVLGAVHEPVLQALRHSANERFDGVDIERSGQAAFLRGALATIEVRPRTAIEAGDHTLMLLEVLALERDDSQEPLVFFGGGVHRIAM